jgi:hypothetical protein
MGNLNNVDLFVATDIVPITPNDSTDLAIGVRAIRATVAGTLRITTYAGNVRNTRIAADEVLQVYAVRVHAAGTTATGLEGLV